MKCFLACFGFPVKRKKKRKSFVSPDDARGSYRPLVSFLEENDGRLGVVGDPRSSRSLPSSVRYGRLSLTRKKVRFDLNVRAYEPLPPEDSYSPKSDDPEENTEKKHCEETTPMVASTGGLAFSSNYRYQNCRDSSDEEDGFLYDNGDLVFEKDEDEYFGDDETWGDSHQLDRRSPKDSTSVQSDFVTSSEEQSSLPKFVQDNKSRPVLHLSASIRSSNGARFRNGYVHSVLNPVENTEQWKTVKAKAKLPNRKPDKENRELEGELPAPLKSSITSERGVTSSCKWNSQGQHIPVNASLSSWLVPVKH